MPAEIRHLVKQAAISTAALERDSVDGWELAVKLARGETERARGGL